MAIRFDVRSALTQLERDVAAFRQDQLPFAASLALNSVAAHVRDAELEGFKETFDKPTAFTLNAFTIIPARKSSLRATVLVKPNQAKYLEPYMDGGSGRQVLGASRAILAPRDIALNSFGNIPRGKLASLQGRPDIFIGPITTKSGRVISGVWQRPTPPPAKVKGQLTKVDRLANRTGKLRLLIEFEDPQAVKPRLHYGDRAASAIAKHMFPELEAAMVRAIATAR